MYYGGELNVPGAAGNIQKKISPATAFQPNMNTTGAPVGYTQQATGFMNLPGAIGNVQGMEVADMPRYIKSSPPPNVINKAPHIDSPFIDRWLKERNQLRGPQLPGFV